MTASNRPDNAIARMAGGSSHAELIEEFPDLEEDDLRACIAFARRALTARSQHLALA